MLTTARAFQAVATLLGDNQQRRISLLHKLTAEQWLAAIAAANDHLLGPTLYTEATRRHWLHLVPDDVRDYLALLHRRNVSRNERIRVQLVECVKCLNANGVPCILLKGAASLAAEQELGARIIHDIDLLIPERYLEQAARALIGLGYRPWTDRPSGRHAFGVLARTGDPAALDLHRDIIALRHLAPTDLFWSNCRRIDFAGAHALVPSRGRQLLHVVMHEMVHNDAYIRGSICLRALHDFNRLVAGLSNECWPAIYSELEWRQAVAPFAAMAYAAERLLGSQLPPIPRAGLSSRIFYFRAELRRHGLLPAGVNRVGMYAYKAFARHYFNPALDVPPFLLWRMRRVAHLGGRTLRRWLTGSTGMLSK